MTFEPIWNSLIAWYLFLAGLGAGAYITSSSFRLAWAWPHPGTPRRCERPAT